MNQMEKLKLLGEMFKDYPHTAPNTEPEVISGGMLRDVEKVLQADYCAATLAGEPIADWRNQTASDQDKARRVLARNVCSRALGLAGVEATTEEAKYLIEAMSEAFENGSVA